MRQISTAGSPRPTWLSLTLRWFAPATIAALAVFAFVPRSITPSPATYGQLTTLDIVELVSPDDYVLLTSAEVYEDDHLLTAEL